MAHSIKYPLARLFPAKQELLVIDFPHEQVASGNIAPMLEVLSPLAESRENAERFEGRLAFYFSGWDDDPRETAEIPEIRQWFADLTADFPYWLHFIEKEGDTFFHVLRLLCKGHIERISQEVTQLIENALR
ncbi:chlororespiratory reduction 6 domain-containing protein [Methylocaldum sp. MU1018]